MSMSMESLSVHAHHNFHLKLRTPVLSAKTNVETLGAKVDYDDKENGDGSRVTLTIWHFQFSLKEKEKLPLLIVK